MKHHMGKKTINVWCPASIALKNNSSIYRISPSTSRFKNKSKSNFLGKNVSKIVGSNISRNRNSAKIRDPNDAKFHRSAHYTVESLVPQSTISPDMLVKDPKL